MRDPKYLNIEELAEQLCINVQTVRNRLSRGNPMPPSIKVGRRLLFPIQEFESWMNQHIRSNDGIYIDKGTKK